MTPCIGEPSAARATLARSQGRTGYGAIIGAALFVLAENYLQTLMGVAFGALNASGAGFIANFFNPDRWLLWLGILFILSVYFFPTGIVGKLRAEPKP